MAAVVALMLALMLLSGGAMIGALIVTRRARRELAQRVNHVVGSSSASNGRDAETASPWITALEARLLRVFGVGLARQWGARVPSFQLILIAVLSAVSIWALTRIWVTLPLWIALPLTAIAFILAPRTLLQFQQSRTERRFIEFFPAYCKYSSFCKIVLCHVINSFLTE